MHIQVSLVTPLLIGAGVIVLTIFIHAFALRATVSLVRHEERAGRAGSGFLIDVFLVACSASFALSAHLVEIALWAGLFVIFGELSAFAPAYYHSAVCYTTLGYGDVVMSPAWRLLGPLEAADGMLMFGISTALIFAVIQHFIQVYFALEPTWAARGGVAGASKV
jgi:hypothetical protein